MKKVKRWEVVCVTGGVGNKLNRVFTVLGWSFDINIGRATLETCNATWNLLTTQQ
jgi:hypothetical protein